MLSAEKAEIALRFTIRMQESTSKIFRILRKSAHVHVRMAMSKMVLRRDLAIILPTPKQLTNYQIFRAVGPGKRKKCVKTPRFWQNNHDHRLVPLFML